MIEIVVEQKITVEELFNMELEEGFFYELINGIIVKKSTFAAASKRCSSISDDIQQFYP